jgi:hypothetical protein
MNIWRACSKHEFVDLLVSTTLIAMMMSLAIRGSTCEEGGDDKCNHKDQTTKVNVRNGFEIENILEDLGNKNDNVK